VPADAPSHAFRRGAAHLAIDAHAPVEAVFIACDPPVLGKRQHWWDVGARTIRYSFAYRGREEARETPPGDYAALRRAAQSLTDALKERVFAA
jgi:1-acyl-sn-glycerol-3-phosphate acyltransferase